MKAMILAAGRGSRLKPITDTLPKPLVTVNKKPIIVYHLEKLAKAGFQEVVINLAYLGTKIEQILGNGSDFRLTIHYLYENNNGSEDSLETGGGILNALPLLGNAPFVTINADIYTDFDFGSLMDYPPSALRAPSPTRGEGKLGQIRAPSPTREEGNLEQIRAFFPTGGEGNPIAHLILVPNPDSSVEGNFSFQKDSQQQETHFISNNFPRPYLASGITLYHPDFFKNLSPGRFSVVPLWREYADDSRITGTVHNGLWYDIGTVQKLQALETLLKG